MRWDGMGLWLTVLYGVVLTMRQVEEGSLVEALDSQLVPSLGADGG